MIPELRKKYNEAFTPKAYQEYIKELQEKFPGAFDFRIAETPEFIPKWMGKRLIDACEYIIDEINTPEFLEQSKKAIPKNDFVQGDEGRPHFLIFDFGICENTSGGLDPKLIEMQGFPSLFGLEAFLPEVMKKHFDIPENFSHYFNGLNKESYIGELKKLIVSDCHPENVILLEIRPHQQKTRIDFYLMKEFLGIETVCITEIFDEGKNLFYILNGRKIKIERIYNRIIFDELHATKNELGNIIDIRKDWNVVWVTHPNWFYRISKYSLPFLQHPDIPETFFLNEVKQLPGDLEHFVLKPLFSFAGQGVIIDVTPEDINEVKDPENWILQRKVRYADIIQTPDGGAKVEIRMMYVWHDGDKRPKLLTNLTRLSKGKMVGTRYNKDKEWVGASVAYFEM